jgi:hypothetical protein
MKEEGLSVDLISQAAQIKHEVLSQVLTQDTQEPSDCQTLVTDSVESNPRHLAGQLLKISKSLYTLSSSTTTETTQNICTELVYSRENSATIEHLASGMSRTVIGASCLEESHL